MQSFKNAEKLSKKNKQYSLLQYCYRSIANIYIQQSNLPEVKKYIQLAFDVEKAHPNTDDRANNYYSKAVIYTIEGNYKNAELFFDEAISNYTKSKNYFKVGGTLSEKAIIYYETNPLKCLELEYKASKLLQKYSPATLVTINNEANLAESYLTFADDKNLLNQLQSSTIKEIPKTKKDLLEKAEETLKKTLKRSLEIDSPVTRVYLLGLLSNLNEYKGNIYESLTYLKLEKKLNDSLFSQKNKNAIAKLESERELMELKTKNEKKATLNKILVASSLALLLIGFLGYRNFRNKQNLQNLKITELEKDKQLLAIDAMLKGQEEERGRIAKDLHDGLGGLLSGTKLSFTNMKENLILTPENKLQFEKSLSMLDTTIADLRKVAHNLMPEFLVKFGLNDALRDFCNSIQSSSSIIVEYQKMGIDRKIDNTAETFIYRIIQELVNNAVKHANAKEIIVQLTVENTKVLITVEDDGKGYDKKQTTKGDGLDNIDFRVNYLKGKIDTETSPNNGTSVNIELNA